MRRAIAAPLAEARAEVEKALVERTELMFQWWHEFKAGSLSRSSFQERMGPALP